MSIHISQNVHSVALFVCIHTSNYALFPCDRCTEELSGHCRTPHQEILICSHCCVVLYSHLSFYSHIFHTADPSVISPCVYTDVLKSCQDIVEHPTKRYSGDAGGYKYVIDPDGPGEIKPFVVTCHLDFPNQNGITEVSHF